MKNFLSIAIMVFIGVISFGVENLNSSAELKPENQVTPPTREQSLQIARVAIESLESEIEVKSRALDYEIAVAVMENNPEEATAQDEVDYRLSLLRRTNMISDMRLQNYNKCLDTPADCKPLQIGFYPSEREIREITEELLNAMMAEQNQQQDNFTVPFSPSQSREKEFTHL